MPLDIFTKEINLEYELVLHRKLFNLFGYSKRFTESHYRFKHAKSKRQKKKQYKIFQEELEKM